MINFYGGQKGENYVVSKIFPNRNALIEDLKLDENSEVSLYEIIMISYGEYSSDTGSDYYNNLKADNKHLKLEEGEILFDKDDLNNFNSALFQKVPNGNWQKTDVFIEENVQFDENGDLKNPNDIIQIGLYKYQFLTSSMGATPRLQLFTGEAKEAWEEPEVIEREDFSVAIPRFDLLMPKAPTIIGSNGEKDENGKIINQGIFINPNAKDVNTDINPYQVIKFDIIEKDEDILQIGNNSEISYQNTEKKIFGVNYEANKENSPFQEIQDIRGPEGPPGRPPVLKDGKWYNWTLNNDNELVLSDTGMDASFNIKSTFSSNAFTKEQIINNATTPVGEYKDLLQKSNDIVIGVLTASDDPTKTYTVMYYLKEDTTIGSALFVKSSSDAYLEQGINTYAIEQRVLEQANTTNNIAGAKGYYYIEINVTTKQIRVSETRTNPPKIIKTENKLTPNTSFTTPEGWIAGDGISLINDSKYDYLSHDNTAVISQIENDIITYTGELGFTTIAEVGTPKIDDYTIYVPSKPDKGQVLIREGSIAFGDRTKSNGLYSLAEGRETEARGNYAHAEGRQTIANYASHSEGYGSKAYGQVSHAEGQKTEARASFSHTEGDHTIAGSTTQHVQGRCNIIDTENKYAHIVGNGSSPTNRRNIHTVDWNGNAWFAGNIISKKYDNITLNADQWSFNDNTNAWIYTIKIQDIDITLTNYSDFDIIIDLDYSKIPNINKQQIYLYHKEYSKLGRGYSVIDNENAQIIVFDVKPEINLPILIKVV